MKIVLTDELIDFLADEFTYLMDNYGETGLETNSDFTFEKYLNAHIGNMERELSRMSTKKKTIGEMTKSRGTWRGINPLTRILDNKKKKNDRQKAKRELNRGEYN